MFHGATLAAWAALTRFESSAVDAAIVFWSRLFAVSSEMTGNAKRDAVGEIMPKFWIVNPRLDMMRVQSAALRSTIPAGVIVAPKHITSPLSLRTVLRTFGALSVAVLVKWTCLALLKVGSFEPRFTFGTSFDSGKCPDTFMRGAPLFKSALTNDIRSLSGGIGAFSRAVLTLRTWRVAKFLAAMKTGCGDRRPFTFSRTETPFALGIHARRDGEGLAASFTHLFDGLHLRRAASLVTAFFGTALTAVVLESICGNLECFATYFAGNSYCLHRSIIWHIP